jgi:hypothetical protein
MDALESLPELLSNTTETLSIYYTSEVMHRKTSNLYVAILQALDGVMAWFKQKAASE